MFQLRSSASGTPRDHSFQVSKIPSALEATSASDAAAAEANGRPVTVHAARKTADISSKPVISALTFRQSCTSRTGDGPVCDTAAGRR